MFNTIKNYNLLILLTNSAKTIPESENKVLCLFNFISQCDRSKKTLHVYLNLTIAYIPIK